MDILKKMFGLNGNEKDAATHNKGWVFAWKIDKFDNFSMLTVKMFFFRLSIEQLRIAFAVEHLSIHNFEILI